MSYFDEFLDATADSGFRLHLWPVKNGYQANISSGIGKAADSFTVMVSPSAHEAVRSCLNAHMRSRDLTPKKPSDLDNLLA